MNLVVCPHCKSHRIVTSRVPKDVIVVMSCPSCGELVVLFRKKVIALDRSTLEEGTLEEKKEHIAGVIVEFLEPGIFRIGTRGFRTTEGPASDEAEEPIIDESEESEERAWQAPISEREFKEFTHIQLKRLDDAAYFKRHFG